MPAPPTRGGGRAAEEPTACEAHQPCGPDEHEALQQLPVEVLPHLCVSRYGAITCSLTVYSEPLVLPREEDVPLVGVLVDAVDRRA